MTPDYAKKFLHDYGLTGDIHDRPVAMAYRDLEVARIFAEAANDVPSTALSQSRRDFVPEEAVAAHFARRYADPTSEFFILSKPLAPAISTGTRADRRRNEIARQWRNLELARGKLGSTYVPVQLGGVQEWRVEVRCNQLRDDPELLAKYKTAFGIK